MSMGFTSEPIPESLREFIAVDDEICLTALVHEVGR